MEGPVGLEPTTPCLKGRCSNQLSYGPKYIVNVYDDSYAQVNMYLVRAAYFLSCRAEALRQLSYGPIG